jgi:hypothetical protein
VLLLVFGTIALLFGVLLDPGEDLEGCSTGLYPGHLRGRDRARPPPEPLRPGAAERRCG